MACQCDTWNVECPLLGFIVKKSLWHACQRQNGGIAIPDKTNILHHPPMASRIIEFNLTFNKLGVMQEVKTSESRLP